MPTTVASNHRKMAGTIFGRINAKNVYFLIDISGSMYSALKDVKEHMITAITEKATKEYDGMFNIVAFSDEVYSWASSLMPCTPRTVSIAAEWVRYEIFMHISVIVHVMSIFPALNLPFKAAIYLNSLLNHCMYRHHVSNIYHLITKKGSNLLSVFFFQRNMLSQHFPFDLNLRPIFPMRRNWNLKMLLAELKWFSK